MEGFIIDRETQKKAWQSNQYWYKLSTGQLRSIDDLSQMDRPNGVSQTSYFVSLGYIPFVSVCEEEVIKAFCETIADKKLKDTLQKLDDSELVEGFWKYCNVYSELASSYPSFEDEYVIGKIKKWCDENNIKY